MPQPLSKLPSGPNIIIGNAGDRPLLRHPQLAALAIEAIASWSNVESFMLNMFIQLLGGNESLAADIYIALENQSAKTAAINAAANSVLKDKPDQLKVLKAILSIAKTNEKDRNKLAHWTWGDSPDIPDGILLVNPKTSISNKDISQVYVYKEQDFISIIKANDRLCDYGLRFNWILQGHIANQDNKLLNELLAEPEIQDKLNRKPQ